jgi:hypothetical protein
MNLTISNGRHKGVICLFCGQSTAISTRAEERCSANPEDHPVSIVRCHQCGKESIYLSTEIVDLQAA